MDYKKNVLFWEDYCVRCGEHKRCIQADNVLGSPSNFCLDCVQESIFKQLLEDKIT